MSFIVKCLIEVPGLNNEPVRESMEDYIRSEMSEYEHRFGGYIMSDVQRFEAGSALCGALASDAPKILNLARGMRERRARQAISLMEKDFAEATKKDEPQLPVQARQLFDLENAILNGYSNFFYARDAFAMIQGTPTDTCSDLCIMSYNHKPGYPANALVSAYPTEEDIAYIEAHIDEFAYVDVLFCDFVNCDEF